MDRTELLEYYDGQYTNGYARGCEDSKKGEYSPPYPPMKPTPLYMPPGAPFAARYDSERSAEGLTYIYNILKQGHDAYMEGYKKGFAEAKGRK